MKGRHFFYAQLLLLSICSDLAAGRPCYGFFTGGSKDCPPNLNALPQGGVVQTTTTHPPEAPSWMKAPWKSLTSSLVSLKERVTISIRPKNQKVPTRRKPKPYDEKDKRFGKGGEFPEATEDRKRAQRSPYANMNLGLEKKPGGPVLNQQSSEYLPMSRDITDARTEPAAPQLEEVVGTNSHQLDGKKGAGEAGGGGLKAVTKEDEEPKNKKKEEGEASKHPSSNTDHQGGHGSFHSGNLNSEEPAGEAVKHGPHTEADSTPDSSKEHGKIVTQGKVKAEAAESVSIEGKADSQKPHAAQHSTENPSPKSTATETKEESTGAKKG